MRLLFNPAAQSSRMETMIVEASKIKLPSTKVMIDKALIALHDPKGVSLFKLKKYLCQKYAIDITRRRKNLINVYLHSLLAATVLKNVKGKGLAGHFRLSSIGAFRNSVNKSTTAATVLKRKSTSTESVQTPPNQIPRPATPPIAPRLSNATQLQQEMMMAVEETPNQSWARRMRKRRLNENE